MPAVANLLDLIDVRLAAAVAVDAAVLAQTADDVRDLAAPQSHPIKETSQPEVATKITKVWGRIVGAKTKRPVAGRRPPRSFFASLPRGGATRPSGSHQSPAEKERQDYMELASEGSLEAEVAQTASAPVPSAVGSAPSEPAARGPRVPSALEQNRGNRVS